MNPPDHTRPLMLGYLREHFLMDAAELARARDLMTRFAAAEGFTLQAIYVERLETEPAAFQTLVDVARRDNVAAVVVPSPTHLETRVGASSRREHLEHYADVHVLVAPEPPP